MIVGSYPPESCGVGGYVARLEAELQNRTVKVETLHEGPWTLAAFFARRRAIRKHASKLRARILHFQYPSVGFGRSLAAPFLALALRLLGFRIVTTIHEASQVHPLRRLALIPFFIASHAVVFTNSHELNYTARFIPGLRGKATVIPVGSTIQTGGGSKVQPANEVLYFGLIRPEKGIEKFIEVAKLAALQKSLVKFRIVGARDPRFQSYYEGLRSDGADSVAWTLDGPETAVAETLSRAHYAYFPFPDGASDRRTSLMAALVNRVAVLTTEGRFTADEMSRRLQPLAIEHTADEALARIESEMFNENQLRHRQSEAFTVSCLYAWSTITDLHIALYFAVSTTAIRRA